MSKRDKLAALRKAREGGVSISSVYEAPKYDSIYEEIEEDDYRKRKRDQLLKEDFVVGDDGNEYVDDGNDNWGGNGSRGRGADYSGDEEGNELESGKSAQNQKKNVPINKFFKPSSSLTSSNKSKRKDRVNVEDILFDFDLDVPKKTRKLKRTSSPASTLLSKKQVKVDDDDIELSSSSFLKRTKTIKPKEKYLEVDSEIKEIEEVQNETPDVAMEDIDSNKENIATKISTIEVKTEPSEPSIDIEPKEDEDDDDDDDDDIVVTRRPRRTANNIDRSVNIQAKKEVKVKKMIAEDEEDERVPDSPTKSDSFSSFSSQSRGRATADEVLDENGNFKMYWMDYAEADNSLLLFGKIKTNSGAYVSNILQVNGIEKELFFLPRKTRRVDEEDEEDGEEAKDKGEPSEVTPEDIHDEIVPLIMDKYGLNSIKAKPETKKYAFELPDIPKETEYLKVLMPYQTAKNKTLNLPSDLEGDTFSKVFGTSTNIFESFILQRNIMGPCWLEVSNGDFQSLTNTSHCDIEVCVSAPKFIKPIDDKSLESPVFNCLSLHVQPIFNEKTNTQEVAAVSISNFSNVNIDHISPDTKPVSSVTLVRPVGILKSSFPPGLDKASKKLGLNVRTFPTEKTLINCLCALIKNHDPDFFVGHNLESSSLDILIHRMHELKVPTWSNFGRRNRKVWPERLTRMSRNNSGNSLMNNMKLKEIFQGRLICDISNELGKSVTLKCQSWELSEMYDLVCKKKLFNADINLNQSQFSEDANALLSVLKDVLNRCNISVEIAFQLQILSLSRTLTTIAGNAWSHTLGGTRSGRSEFFLLHEFTRDNYIVPDKESWASQNKNKIIESKEDSRDNDDDEKHTTSNRKAQYKGGLVLEPEVGLHKTFIVVMDFNSLYPSIIQEFNICFTTIDREEFNKTQREDDLPAYPSVDVPQGILPKLLNSLVSRRREVKKLLKDPKLSSAEKSSFDIKQLALKLQANSLYGYLGFEKSRFYAKALAMLVTAKGREILMETRKMAETIDLHTIYGDTDSLMIETGTLDYNEAIEAAAKFQQLINGKHTILELGLDNVFKSILLHSKKKYAAVNVVPAGDGKFTETLEVKGLDLKRREYSPLTKETSNFILNKILSDQDSEEVLSEIYDHLEALTSDIKNNKIRPEKFKINTRLSKDPKNYPGGKSMPQVQVALRLRKQGKIVKAGSVITYIICSGEEGSPAERARSLQEVLGKNSNLTPDPKYYLEKQLFNPLERLLQTYPGIDMVRLANCLGLDGRKYERHNASNRTSVNGLQPFESTISDEERYKYSKFLELQCSCGSKFRYGGIVPSFDYKIGSGGVMCKHCNKTMSTLRITSQLERQIRSFISLYYSSWLICDDPSCEITTRQMSVYGRKCLSASCDGLMRYKYSDQELYRQLMYFSTIFDVEKMKKNSLKQIYSVGAVKPDPITDSQVSILAEQNKEFFHLCRSIVDKYLNNSARRFVDMGSIFSFMMEAGK
ncbi:DNA-directed DNA polymerase alpha catalytic subunit [Saccharomycopsis crataegensis]|uniref:DNA polymerase n=1 Tax=Saccharomycopsis crataegensis TaxID=43959 RepID=A0AAV5QDE4_9ASCO|nr:DNA-directed DNA polymerase alpha catalytic subunit [Saccharomycopsis crataegensis]